MDFVVIDVETANPNLSSICQVGMASFRDGRFQEGWKSLVNPEDYFDGINVSIHGIDEDMVQDAPVWSEVFPNVSGWLQQRIVVSHTPFDRLAITRACEKSGVQFCECVWLDSARVVRRAWPQFARAGYGLSNVAREFGITYQQHDALSDARCAGEILLRAIAESGIDVEQWLQRVNHPIDIGPIKRAGNPEGSLHGEVLVFTGALSIPRCEAAQAAAAAGCEVGDNVTKHTTLLVVGDQDITQLAGHEKSGKHRKAEQLIAKGQRIRILGESDLQRLVLSHAADRAATAGSSA